MGSQIARWVVRAVAAAPVVIAALGPAVARAADGPEKTPHVIFIVGESEYKSEQTMPAVAKVLQDRYGMRCTVLMDKNIKDAWTPKVNERINDIPGLEALADADLPVRRARFVRKVLESEVGRRG